MNIFIKYIHFKLSIKVCFSFFLSLIQIERRLLYTKDITFHDDLYEKLIMKQRQPILCLASTVINKRVEWLQIHMKSRRRWKWLLNGIVLCQWINYLISKQLCLQMILFGFLIVKGIIIIVIIILSKNEWMIN